MEGFFHLSWRSPAPAPGPASSSILLAAAARGWSSPNLTPGQIRFMWITWAALEQGLIMTHPPLAAPLPLPLAAPLPPLPLPLGLLLALMISSRPMSILSAIFLRTPCASERDKLSTLQKPYTIESTLVQLHTWANDRWNDSPADLQSYLFRTNSCWWRITQKKRDPPRATEKDKTFLTTLLPPPL